MTWTKRDPVSNLVVLGDDEGHVSKAGGLLASLRQDTMYPSRSNYEMVQKDGESLWLAGSASLSRQIGEADVGHFIKVTFKGWGKSANGKFKDIEVLIYEGDVTEDMKKWPRWKELQGVVVAPKGRPAKPAAEDVPDPTPPPDGDDDEDLPF